MQSKDAAQGTERVFMCQTSGGYPQPTVYWSINDSEHLDRGSVRTLTSSLPDSILYNITSYLTVNISGVSTVSCRIENPSINETLKSEKREYSHQCSAGSQTQQQASNLHFLSVLSYRSQQPCGEASIRGHVDLQHMSLCGGWGNGDCWSGVSDSPGQDK